MSSMFQNCENFDEDISDWPAISMTNNVGTNYDNYGYGCDAHTSELFKDSDIDYFSS